MKQNFKRLSLPNLVISVTEYPLCKMRYYAFLSVALLLLILLNTSTAHSRDQLIMITDTSCMVCKMWENDLGSIYPKTEIAKSFPLKRLQYFELTDEFKSEIPNIFGTPTFIFLLSGSEIGRIEGYTDPEMFWWLVDEILISAGISSE